MLTTPIPDDWLNQLPGESGGQISRVYDRISYPAGFTSFRWDIEDIQAQVCHFVGEEATADGPCYLVAFICQPPAKVIEHMRDWTDANTDLYIVSAGGATISQALMRIRYANADDGSRTPLIPQLKKMGEVWAGGLLDELIDSFGRQMGKSRAVFSLREYQNFMKPRAQDSGFEVTDMPDGECRFMRGIS
jgi:hypothetical protein